MNLAILVASIFFFGPLLNGNGVRLGNNESQETALERLRYNFEDSTNANVGTNLWVEVNKPENANDVLVARIILGTLVALALTAAVAKITTCSRAKDEQDEKQRASALMTPTTPGTLTIHTRHLDALRFPAAVWVICFHYTLRQDVLSSPWENFVTKGRGAVTFFFVLSGFMTHCLGQGNDSCVSFWVKRFTRVSFTYYGAAMTWVFVQAAPFWSYRPIIPKKIDLIYFSLMIQTWAGHEHAFKINDASWFVASVAFAWLTYPLWQGVLSRMNLAFLAFFAVAFAAVTPGLFYGSAMYSEKYYYIFEVPYSVHDWFYTWPPFCLAEFALGSVVCQIVKNVSQRFGDENDLNVHGGVSFLGSALRLLRPFLCDLTFAAIIACIVMVGRSVRHCGSWEMDGCENGWIVTQCVAPGLISFYLLISTAPRSFGDLGLAVRILESELFASKILVRSTLAMFMFADAVAMLMARSSLLHQPVEFLPISGDPRVAAYSLTVGYVFLVVAVVWLVSWFWSFQVEDRVCELMAAVWNRKK